MGIAEEIIVGGCGVEGAKGGGVREEVGGRFGRREGAEGGEECVYIHWK